MKSVFYLGTRKSLLAWAQSTWVAREVEKLNPGIQVKLIGIETQGDRIVDIPLRKVEGKEFFVAEIDEALRSKRIDFAVHSLKDLSLDRPSDFCCAAIPKRENPRDVILFSPKILDRIRSQQTLRIGTSSPRRIENIPQFLNRALPHLNPIQPRIDFLEIRGNVNTRLKRIHEEETSERYLDGVVLAFAGLIRLWGDPQGKAELEKLLLGARWMVLPLQACPAAPGQGALAIECRAEDSHLKALLSKIHHPATALQVEQERRFLVDSGGGCHQRFGATSIFHPELEKILFLKGKNTQGKELNQLIWNIPPKIPASNKLISFWDGWIEKANTVETRELSEAEKFILGSSSAWFCAHSRAMTKSITQLSIQPKRLWTSGVESWFKLAEKGFWVEGCAESLGFEQIESQFTEAVLGLPALKDWVVLTHADALKGWENYSCHVIATYKVISSYGYEEKSKLQAATHLFWSSGSQFLQLKDWASPDAVHSCGPGKTAQVLRDYGFKPLIFPSKEEWKKWIHLHRVSTP